MLVPTASLLKGLANRDNGNSELFHEFFQSVTGSLRYI
jgi:hypothetical protein